MNVAVAIPEVRGRLTADAPLAPLVWFKSGGAAEFLFEPADANDLADFLRSLDPSVPVMGLGLGSNLIVRDGGHRPRPRLNALQPYERPTRARETAARSPTAGNL